MTNIFSLTNCLIRKHLFTWHKVINIAPFSFLCQHTPSLFLPLYSHPFYFLSLSHPLLLLSWSCCHSNGRGAHDRLQQKPNFHNQSRRKCCPRSSFWFRKCWKTHKTSLRSTSQIPTFFIFFLFFFTFKP